MAQFAGHQATTERFAISPDGTGTYERYDGPPPDLDEMLGMAKRRAPPPTRPPIQCEGHVAPQSHKSAVDAARAVVAAGCRKPSTRPEMPSWSLEVQYGDKVTGCSAGPGALGWPRFEEVRDKIIEAICAR
jgi:hypothetical protein